MARWIAHSKGGPNESFEIYIIKEDNIHGMKSYGWFDENKLLVSHSGGPCDVTVDSFMWDKLILLAIETANQLNRKGK